MTKTLTLALKKKWFDMIKAGLKKEEYRECSDYWIRRFEKLCREFEYVFLGHPGMIDERRKMISAGGLKCDRIVFTSGYPKSNDKERRLEFKNPKIRIGTGLTEWGATPRKLYFVITWEHN